MTEKQAVLRNAPLADLQQLGPYRLEAVLGVGSQPRHQRARQHVAHGDQNQWHTQGDRHPEAASHVIQLMGIFLDGRLFRLERHATLRAGAGADLLHFGVHGTGVDDTR